MSWWTNTRTPTASSREIVDLIGAHHNVMAVGDDAQCIYSWRGASVENILTFPDRHPHTQIHRIETNYRSTPQILALANGVLLAQPKGRHFDKELRPHRANSEKPYFVQAMDAREQAQFIVSRLRGLMDSGCELRDIAVLYRAHFQALDLQLELSRLQIPYHITSGASRLLLEQAHVRDLVALLRFVFNPSDVSAWQRMVILLPKVGEKAAQKIYGVALDHARLMQKDFLDVLETDDVLSKVPKDAKEEWPRLVASLQQVAAAMKDTKPADGRGISLRSTAGAWRLPRRAPSPITPPAWTTQGTRWSASPAGSRTSPKCSPRSCC